MSPVENIPPLACTYAELFREPIMRVENEREFQETGNTNLYKHTFIKPVTHTYFAK